MKGYYTAEELIEDYLERDSTDAKNVWFDNKFDNIGIGEVQGNLNGCPTQLIVVHAAGYVPPNYKKEDIESWKISLFRLERYNKVGQILKITPIFIRTISTILIESTKSFL